MSTLELKQKAWFVWVENEEFEGYPHFGNKDSLQPVYAENIGAAKGKCEFSHKSFTEIKAVRSKENDLVMFEGRQVLRAYAANIELSRYEKQKRIDEIMKFPESATFYVQNQRQPYIGNSINLWAKNSKGYTTNPELAHKYTRKEIIDDFIKRDTHDTIWESSHLESNVSKHIDSQNLNHKYAIK